MKKNLITIFVITFLTSCIGAGNISGIKNKGKDYFPSMTGIDLVGQQRVIPESFEWKYNIVAVAFKREQQTDVNSWISVADEIIIENNNVGFYEIPLIYEINAPYRFWVNNGMRSGIPDPKARLRTITVYTDRDKFLNLMDMNSDNIYILLIDKSGKIIWNTKGIANAIKIKELRNVIAKLN